MRSKASQPATATPSATSTTSAKDPGFRKIRPELDVTEFGVNAIVLPAGIETGFHMHERQQELYFVHAGEIEIEFGDGEHARARAGRPRAGRRRRPRARSATRRPTTPST